jgi:hypothetical protein
VTNVLLGAVVVLAVLSLVNLLLILGVVRRLRDYDARLAGGGLDGPALMRVEVGARVPDVTTQAVDGQAVRLPAGEPALVGFFSPECDACHERLDDFRRAVAAHRGPAVAVVVRDGGDVAALSAGLTGVSVVVEDLGGPVTAAFGVQAFPMFVHLDADGRVLARGYELPQSLVR